LPASVGVNSPEVAVPFGVTSTLEVNTAWPVQSGVADGPNSVNVTVPLRGDANSDSVVVSRIAVPGSVTAAVVSVVISGTGFTSDPSLRAPQSLVVPL
jgi:hypothetical protein